MAVGLPATDARRRDWRRRAGPSPTRVRLRQRRIARSVVKRARFPVLWQSSAAPPGAAAEILRIGTGNTHDRNNSNLSCVRPFFRILNQKNQLKNYMKPTTRPKTAKTGKVAARPQAAIIPAQPRTGPATIAPASSSPASRVSHPIATEASIASRAYSLWEQAGRPHGRDLEYWLLAESQVKQTSQSFSA